MEGDSRGVEGGKRDREGRMKGHHVPASSRLSGFFLLNNLVSQVSLHKIWASGLFTELSTF